MIYPNKMIQTTTLLSEGVLLGTLNRCGFPSVLQEPKAEKYFPKLHKKKTQRTVFEVTITFLSMTFLFNCLRGLELYVRVRRDSSCSSPPVPCQCWGG